MSLEHLSHLKSQSYLASPIDSIGFESPNTKSTTIILINYDSVELLLRFGIRVEGEFGENNLVVLDVLAPKINLKLKLSGGRNNVVVLEGKCILNNSSFNIEGSDHLIFICKSQGNSCLNVTMRREGGFFYWGKSCTSNATNCLIHGPVLLCVGEDCMFAVNTTLRTFDSHAIVDLIEATQINLPKCLTIGRHVWFGQDSLIMPATSMIHEGSIIGARSIVTKTVLKNSLVVGMPGKSVKENVSWTRADFPDDCEIEKLISLLR